MEVILDTLLVSGFVSGTIFGAGKSLAFPGSPSILYDLAGMNLRSGDFYQKGFQDEKH